MDLWECGILRWRCEMERFKILISTIMITMGIHGYANIHPKSNILSSLFLMMMCLGLFMNGVEIVLFMVDDWRERKIKK